MSTNGVEQKPSDTAMFAALRRAIANKDYQNERFGPDYLAELFLPANFRFIIKFTKIRANVKKKLNGFLPGLHEYMIARTAYFDRIFMDALDNKIPQIVLLGAGYDSRAYRFADLISDTKIIELDIATTQNRKKECLRKAKVEIPKHVSFIPIDFNNESLQKVLEKAGYENHKKTLFLWEGVSYYLESDSVDATLEFVSRSAHIGSAIALDYTISIAEENMDDYGVKEFYQTMKEHHSNEELMFAIDAGKIVSFLGKRGLKLVDYLDNEQIERKFLINEDGSLIGQIPAHFRFLMASPSFK
ncbi:MAG: SAM-dependent methyltransferase [Anaerolineaceae bacterium]|nr:SAM-dependent methyltransferase [Anaerolineaceae bacterium]